LLASNLKVVQQSDVLTVKFVYDTNDMTVVLASYVVKTRKIDIVINLSENLVGWVVFYVPANTI